MNVYSSGPKDEPTATGAAFKGVGISTGKDIGKVFSSDEVADFTKKIRELTSRAMDPSARVNALQDRAEEDAETLGRAYQSRSKIRGIRREHSLPDEMFAEEEANAQALIDLIEDSQNGNIFAYRINKERSDALHREQRNERFAARKSREDELFSRATNGFTLHDAVAGMDGDFALRYRYYVVDDKGNRLQKTDRETRSPLVTGNGDPIHVTRDGVALLSCSGDTAEIIDCTQRSVMERMSGKRVPLRPADEFETNRGEPFFSIPVREGLVRRWKAEESNARRHAMSEKREISFTEGQTKKGVAAAHWPPQRPYLSGKRKGPLSVVISFTGKGNFTLEDVFSSQFEEFLAPAVGQKLSLDLPGEPAADADEETKKAFQRHKFLVNLINRRVEYEAIQGAREAAREAEGLNTDEPEEEASSEEMSANS